MYNVCRMSTRKEENPNENWKNQEYSGGGVLDRTCSVVGVQLVGYEWDWVGPLSVWFGSCTTLVILFDSGSLVLICPFEVLCNGDGFGLIRPDVPWDLLNELTGVLSEFKYGTTWDGSRQCKYQYHDIILNILWTLTTLSHLIRCCSPFCHAASKEKYENSNHQQSR